MANDVDIVGQNRRAVSNWLTSVESPQQSDTCSHNEFTDTLSTMDEEDPWTWDTDRVVQELCTENRTWPPLFATQLLPDAKQLEINLREQEIDGPWLLTEITHQILRDDFGIVGPRSIKYRATILHAISYFRGKSQQYAHYVQQHGLQSRLDGGDFRESERSVTTSKAYVRLPTDDGVLPEIPGESQVTTKEPPQVHLRSRTPEPIVAQNNPVPTSVDADDGGRSQLHSEELAAIGDRNKRKRLAPTLLSQSIDPERHREIPTAADNVRIYDPQNLEPGVVFMGDDGKKRMVPVPQPGHDGIIPHIFRPPELAAPGAETSMISGGVNALEAAKKLVHEAESKNRLQKSTASLADGYLGKKSLAVDNIFYSGVPVGKEVPLSDGGDGDFCQSYADISTGRRLYVNKRMNFLLRSQAVDFRRRGKGFTAVIPYPSRLKPRFQTPSFSLFYTTPNGNVITTREDITSWPELNLEQQKPSASSNGDERERFLSFNLPGNMSLGGPSSYDNWDPEVALEKYRHIDGGDEVLPLFGESDEDGEYDIETWREIEEERGTQEKASIVSKRHPLTSEEVSEAIDQGMALLHTKWHNEQLPKRQPKAWSIWQKSRTRNTKREKINAAQQHLDRIVNDRLVKMRQEILNDKWTTQKQVHRQCQIMEQSIFDREDLLWQISVLEQTKPPAKPSPPNLPAPKSKKTKVQQLDLEAEEDIIDTESDSASSGDEMEGFIVSDEESERTDANELVIGSDDSEFRRSRDQNYGDVVPSVEPGTVDDTPMSGTVDELSDIDHKLSRQNLPPSSPLSSPQTPASSRLRHGTSVDESSADFVDLTVLSDSPEIIDLVTPSKPQQKTSAGESSLGSNTPKAKYSNILEGSRTSDSGVQSDAEKSVAANKPPKDIPYNKPATIASYGYKAWEEENDPARLVIAVLHNMPKEARTSISELLSAHNSDELWPQTVDVMRECCDGKDKLRGMDQKTFRIFTGVIRLFEMYVECKKIKNRKDRLAPKTCQKLIDNAPEKFKPFTEACLAAIEAYVDVTAPLADGDDDEEPLLRTKRSLVTRPILSDEEPQDTPRKRQRKIFENVEARKLREDDQMRLQEQEGRRQILRKKLAQSGSSLNSDRAKIIINESKYEDEGFIFVHDHIGSRIKNHQIDGVRFMWSQIVSKGGAAQGCLLAHTMGLGKTMQVITLLVAIAEAACSEDSTVSSQIPERLKRSRTLILSPPGLMDNWMDELLTWVPEKDVGPKIGRFRKVDSNLKFKQRLVEIDLWYKNGGIILLGFEMFRNILNMGPAEDRKSIMDQATFEVVEEQLLKGPNIIIADEAHKLKNTNSALTIAANRFESNSRIALTGSPLSNNVEEYHSMIEWIAPNYLGPIVEFRAKFVEPIQEGLYGNSTIAERRRALKMLEVLKEDISPKVNRADSSVLKNDLKPKIEFIITVPLTDLQHKAYTIYVQAMLESPLDENQFTQNGKIRQTTLWSWIGILALLCNHPICFKNKLAERKTKADTDSKTRLAGIASNGDADEDIVVPSDISQTLISKVADLFGGYGPGAENANNSYKTKILVQILDASREVGDKVLIFSTTIATLDYLENLCILTKRNYGRLDGSTPMAKRQGFTKEFNTGDAEVYLISTTAGGLGLNLYGANRVIIFDFKWNPINEEQAVGRAYRLGQKKPVYVYRFIAGGTFEEKLHNQAVFKKQLASQLVDKQHIFAVAKREKGEFLFKPKHVEQKDLANVRGMDPSVLDKILDSQADTPSIRHIIMTDTFNRKGDDNLTAEERKEVQQLLQEEKLKRSDPAAWQTLVTERLAMERRKNEALYAANVKSQSGIFQNTVSGQSPTDLYSQRAQVGSIIPKMIPPPSQQPGAAIPKSTDANRNDSLSRPRTPRAILPSSQTPRTPSRPPIMGSGTMSIGEDSQQRIQPLVSSFKSFKKPSPVKNAGDGSLLPSPSTPATSRHMQPRQLVGSQDLIHNLELSLQQGGDSQERASDGLAASIYENLQLSTGDNYDLLSSRAKEMTTHFEKDRGFRDKVVSRALDVKRAIKTVFGDIVDTPKTTPQVHGNGNGTLTGIAPESSSSNGPSTPPTAKAFNTAATMGGLLKPKVGQTSNISSAEQSRDVQPQNQPIPKSLSRFGSSFSPGPRTDTN
jgi:SNF2 family DNA or RNA helicase